MNNLVVLNLGFGSLQEGFGAVIARFWESDNPYPMQFTGSLPPAPEITTLYKQWQLLYSALYEKYSRVKLDTGELKEVKNVSAIGLDELCQELSNAINNWLNSQQFRDIERPLRARLERAEEIQFVIETTDNVLRRLPWHLWNFFDDYPIAEVALSAPRYERAPKLAIKRSGTKAKILAILGNSEGIDTDKDKIFIEQLSEQAEIKFLPEPQPEELNAQLWESGWDIVFFAGHSSSEEKDSLQLNQQDSLKLEKLRYALKQAISGGLRLAIFNSCDGLGLAEALASLHIPQVIVMREPVPDLVAQEFLKHFLAAFSGGQSLYAAVRSARERLKRLEFKYPCASWLPVICQNLAEPPTTWQKLCGSPEQDNSPTAITEPKSFPDPKQVSYPAIANEPNSLPASDRGSFPTITTEPNSRPSTNLCKSGQPSNNDYSSVPTDNPKQGCPDLQRFIGPPAPKKRRSLAKMLLASLTVAAGVMAVRHLGVLQSWELQAFDQLVRMRPDEKPDRRILVVTIDENDIKAQNPKLRRDSISDWALNRVLEKLEQLKPRVIGLDIYRPFPTPREDLKTRFAESELVTVCKVRSPLNNDPGIAPPEDSPPLQQSFSDVLQDHPDDVVRRHLLAMEPDPASPCRATYSFSVALALRYLAAEGIMASATKEGFLRIKNVTFKPLQSHASGYQNIDSAGHQVLLNYRSPRSPKYIADQVSLMQVLWGQINPNLVKDRVVLIGNTASSFGDVTWNTPFSSQESNGQLPGVLLQAQMLSQILSAVDDQRPRPLLWVWPIWGEALWIWGWAVVGGVLALCLRSPVILGLCAGFALGVLYALCFTLLLQGAWVPLVPSAISLVITSTTVIIVIAIQNIDSREKSQ